MCPFINVNGCNIYCEVYGNSGSWLTFIHGAWASSKWWFNQVNEFSKNYKVLTIDLRGHGKSCKIEKL